jgi:predicted dehydrogenase
MTRKLKAGLIGVGGVARLHMPGWKDNADAELIALADTDPIALKEKGSEWEIARLYDSAQALLADPEIDLIDLCVPNAYHATLAIAALEAGKHVMCEKPLAPTPADIRRMIAARDRSGKMLMTAQHLRFHPRSLALRAHVDAGELGPIYHARCWALRRAAVPCRTSFTLKQHSGGGPVIDIGVHVLDLAMWMMGSPTPITVSGTTHARLHKQEGTFSIWGGPVPKEWDVEEFASALVRFDNGASVVLEVSWLLHHHVPEGQYEDMQVWLYGEKGGANWPANQLLSSDPATQQFRTTTAPPPDKTSAHARECQAFAEAVALGKPSPVPAEQSLHLMAVLQGLYESAQAGREVSLNRDM